MPSLKEYKAKLVSLGNTRKMTKTMKMVAASKLYRAMDAQRKAQRYAIKLSDLAHRLAGSLGHAAHPLLARTPEPKKALMLIIMSDKGMCGGFNNHLIRHIARWLQMPQQMMKSFKMSFVGRRGWIFFRNRVAVETKYEHITQRPTLADAQRITDDLSNAFLSGAADEIFIAYNHFNNPLSQRPIIRKILPMEPVHAIIDLPKVRDDLIIEPHKDEILAFFLPKILNFEIYFALLENAAGENGARMTAMDSATTNATKMIRTYTLLRDRARQASITKELIEIVSGAEALKG